MITYLINSRRIITRVIKIFYSIILCNTSINNFFPRTSVRVGEHDIRKDPDCELSDCAPAVQDRVIKKITPHPDFNKPAFHNDIAMLELEKPVDLHSKIVNCKN